MDPDPTNTTTPALRGDRIYFTHLGVVRCLDARTGAEKWNFSPDEAASVITSPVPWENLIIVGATDACLYGLDAADGHKVWERTCAGSISPDPLILNDLLMIGAEKMVYAIQPSTGQATWICSLTSTAKHGPVTDGSMLYFLCEDSSIQCVDATAGRYRWRSQFTSGPRTFDPIVARRRVILASGTLIHGRRHPLRPRR
jgi:outer membrane protein assembly factor BamB